jgi:hypothetical protein
MLMANPSRPLELRVPDQRCRRQMMKPSQDAVPELDNASTLAPTPLSDAGRSLCAFRLAPKWGLGSAFIIKLELAEFGNILSAVNAD